MMSISVHDVIAKGSEAGDPLGPHAFSNYEREGVMVAPLASLHN